MDTTRSYPRTLAEAFRGPDYACAVERPIDKPDRIVLWGCAVVAAALIVWMILNRG